MIKKVDLSNIVLPEDKQVIESLSICCPFCKSTNVKRKFVVPVSNYGHLPKPPVDLCSDCGFKSEESFLTINFRIKRDYKIEQILKEDGIQ